MAVSVAALLSGCGNASEPRSSANATENPTSTTAPSPGITTGPSGVAAPGQVTIDPALPNAEPLRPGIWPQTAPGWVLATYRPAVDATAYGVESQSVAATRQVVYLVRPDGTRYQALELPVSPAVRISSWSAGDSRAFVRGCESDACYRGTGATAVLDLTTGAITSYDAPAGADAIAFTLPNSTRVWEREGDALYYQHPDADSTFLERDGTFTSLGGGWQVAGGPSPDGRWLGLVRWDANPDGTFAERAGIAALANGAVLTLPPFDDGLGCAPSGWSESGAMRLTCYDGSGAGATHKSVVPSTGVVSDFPYTPPAQDQATVVHSVLVAPGVWAGPYGYGDPDLWDMESTFGIDDHGALREVAILDKFGVALPTVGAVAAVDGIVYLVGRRAARDEEGTTTMLTFDPATGKQAVLLPEPPSGPAAALAPNDNTVFAIGVTSWVVAP